MSLRPQKNMRVDGHVMVGEEPSRVRRADVLARVHEGRPRSDDAANMLGLTRRQLA